MSALPFVVAAQPAVESPESAESARREAGAEPAAPTEATIVGQQVLDLKRKLEEAASDFGRLQSSLAPHQQLEQLLRQGRIHLQDLRSRLQQVTVERDRLETEFSDHKTARQGEIDRLQTQVEDARREAFLQQTLAEQRERDMLSKNQDQLHQIDALGKQLQKAAAERDSLAAQLQEREAVHQQFVEERADERSTFQRVLAEATANQRDMVQELDEQRQQIETLREASMRAQSLARQIMRAHEEIPLEKSKP
jgi:chaperonin cofactor prefoldin